MTLVEVIHQWTHNDRLIHSIKTALACLIGFIVGNYIHLQAVQWIVITTLVVMCAQLNVGSVIQKSYMRFLGTLLGSLLAVLALILFRNNAWINIGVVLVAAIFFSFIATSTRHYNEAGTLGAVTVAIILLGPDPSVQIGIHRFFEISLGIFIAAIISQFIFPIHAKTLLRRNQVATIRKIHSLYLHLFCDKSSPEGANKLGNLDEEIVKSLIAQRKLAGEARREKIGKLFNADQFQQSLWCEKEIIRSIIFMFHAYEKSYHSEAMQAHQSQLENFHREVARILENIKNKISTSGLMESIASMKESLHCVTKLEQDERISIDTFIFCAEILVERLGKLIHLLGSENVECH